MIALTIKDIARLSGFGVSTVSRALNGHPDISDSTRAKIQAIIDQYNYIPNSNAKQLKQSAGKSILLIVNGGQNLFFSPIIEQIQYFTDKSGANLSVHYLDEQENEVSAAIRLTAEQKPIGIVFLGGDIRNFRVGFDGINIPCVLSTASAENLGYSNLSSVSVDDFEGGREAVNTLYKLGHRKIGVLCGDTASECPSGLRYNGALSSAEENNIELIEEYCDYTFSSAYNAARQLYDKSSDITAVFAMSDIIAIGAVRALMDMGKRVPEDVSVLGFDGIEITDFYNPRIATFVQPVKEIASLTVGLLTDRIEKNRPCEHIRLKATYKDGGSVGKKPTTE